MRFEKRLFLLAVILTTSVFIIYYVCNSSRISYVWLDRLQFRKDDRSSFRTEQEGIYWIEKNDETWPWKPTETVVCPEVNFKKYPHHRNKVNLQCKGENAALLTSLAEYPSDIQVFHPNDVCLLSFIRNNCHGNKRVPNVVHYIWYNSINVSIFTFVSFISVVRFMKPCLIVFHGPYTPRGELWNFFLAVYPYVVAVNSSIPNRVYGNKLAFREHTSDVMRIEILQKYGGLYLDWDEVLLKPVDHFRNNSVTIGLEKPGHLGNQFIMAERNATFLDQWHRGYKHYSNRWDYNSIVYPYHLAQTIPESIHIVPYKLLKPRPVSGFALWYGHSDWAENYALHFYLRGYKYSNSIDDNHITKLNSTLGAVSRYILFGQKEVCRTVL